MKLFLRRVLRRSIPVMAILALIGYVEGIVLRNFVGGPAIIPRSESGQFLSQALTTTGESQAEGAAILLWRVPLTLALAGLGMVLLLEALSSLVRRSRKNLHHKDLDRSIQSIVIPPPPIVSSHI